jgi:hypothetical protein
MLYPVELQTLFREQQHQLVVCPSKMDWHPVWMRAVKLQIPSTNNQRSSKFQSPKNDVSWIWCLMIGASLVLGDWDLVFRPQRRWCFPGVWGLVVGAY